MSQHRFAVAALFASLALAACGAPPSSSKTGDTFTPLAPPANGIQLHIQPFTVKPQSERERCRFLKAPNTGPGEIVHVKMKGRKGLHHVFVMKVASDYPDGEVPCFGIPDQAMQGIDIPEPIFASSTLVTQEEVSLPQDVAIHLDPGQQLIFDYHYVNVTTQPMTGEIYLNLDFAPAGTKVIPAKVFVFGNMDGIDIPAHGKQTLKTTCTFPKDEHVVSVTPHMHQLGTGFEIQRFDGQQDTGVLYQTSSWDDPKTTVFNPVQDFGAGQGITFTCNWANPTDTAVKFGQSYDDEMCFVFGYFYPATQKLLELDITGGCTQDSP